LPENGWNLKNYSHRNSGKIPEVQDHTHVTWCGLVQVLLNVQVGIKV
jgi:hypothetical protein